MRRRDFIAGLGGAVAWPLAVRAQQSERVRRVGVLVSAGIETDQQAGVAIFKEVLRELGWIDGRNVRVEVRWAGGDPASARKDAEELVALPADVIMANGQLGLEALLRATRSVPIVFNNAVDPVGSGFIDSLARPGGNATGFVLFEYALAGKWVELLKQIAPTVSRVAVLRDVVLPAGTGQFAVIQSAAPSPAATTRPAISASGSAPRAAPATRTTTWSGPGGSSGNRVRTRRPASNVILSRVEGRDTRGAAGYRSSSLSTSPRSISASGAPTWVRSSPSPAAEGAVGRGAPPWRICAKRSSAAQSSSYGLIGPRSERL